MDDDSIGPPPHRRLVRLTAAFAQSHDSSPPRAVDSFRPAATNFDSAAEVDREKSAPVSATACRDATDSCPFSSQHMSDVSGSAKAARRFVVPDDEELARALAEDYGGRRAIGGGASVISGWDSVAPRNFNTTNPDAAGVAGTGPRSRVNSVNAPSRSHSPVRTSRSRSRSPSQGASSGSDECCHEEETSLQRRTADATNAMTGALASMRSAVEVVRTLIGNRSEALDESGSEAVEDDADLDDALGSGTSVEGGEQKAADGDGRVDGSEDDAESEVDADYESGAEDEDESGDASEDEGSAIDSEVDEDGEAEDSAGADDGGEGERDSEDRNSLSENESEAEAASEGEDDEPAAREGNDQTTTANANRDTVRPPAPVQDDSNANGADTKPGTRAKRDAKPAEPARRAARHKHNTMDRMTFKILASAAIVALLVILTGVTIHRARMRAAHVYGHRRWSSGPVTSELPRSLAEAAVRWKDSVTTPLGLTTAYIPGCVVRAKRCREGDAFGLTRKRALEGFLERQSMLGGFVVSNSTKTATLVGCEEAAYRWHVRCNNIASERVYTRFIDSDHNHTLCVYPPRGMGFDLRKHLKAAGVCAGAAECLNVAECFEHKGWGSERWTRDRISNAELSACLPAFGQRLSWLRAGAFQHPPEWRRQMDCEPLPLYTIAREAEVARRIARDAGPSRSTPESDE